MRIGCHLSVANGYEKMGKTALEIGADTFQFFTGNPRGGRAAELALSDVKALALLMKKNNFGDILAHAPYTINMASHKPQTWEFAKETMRRDLDRLKKLPCHLYNFHPGNHTGKGVEYGTKRIAEGLNEILTGNETTLVLLETMAGKGTEIGRSFEELRAVIDGVKYNENLGVCIDTCHIFDAGYDIANNPDDILARFDDIIGIEKLAAVHLNDSKNICGSGKDRHACLGEGKIGLEALLAFAGHPEISKRPILLETPNDLSGYKREIEILRKALDI
ncbi:MAG: deoxyribonuclease IV [Peptostreptococcaceae bacterium]|nr:deoxyribonuclease IV [Peptostreptococcaceae bacterium]